MPYARLLGAQLAIGAAAIFARYALGGAGPIAVSALRLGIATLVVAAFARRLTPLGKRRESAFALAGLALAVHFATWIASLTFTTVAVSTLLVTTTPLWTEAFDAVRLRRAPRLTYDAAVVMALGGVAAIAFARAPSHVPILGHAALGDALALAGSFAIGAYLLIVRAAGAATPQRLATDAIVVRTYAWATLFLAIAAVAAHERPPSLSNGAAWGGIVAMALVSQTLGHTALNAALRTFTPTVVAMTTLLEPVIAAFLAAALFGETLSWLVFCGGVLVLAAVALVLRDTNATAAAA